MMRSAARITRSRVASAFQRVAFVHTGVDDAPYAPSMKTVCPGPESLKAFHRLSEVQECSAVTMFVDYEKSQGNYITDADGNRLLDCFSQIASLPLGYNHPSMISALTNPKNYHIMANRPALGVMPPVKWVNKLEKLCRRFSPESMPPGSGCDITTMACGSTANENAFKAVFIAYMDRHRGGQSASQEDLNSCMLNKAPGCPSLSILSFSGAFHGRTLGCLATTRSKPIHKLDIPHFDWPMAPFPKLQHPLNEFVAENVAEEARCLAEVEHLLKDSAGGIMPTTIAGIIVEPIQAEGGDNHATPDFFRKLRALASDYGVYFIVDEVQTGGGTTGKMWAHDHWKLKQAPDIVTFAKKAQIAGFFSGPSMRPKVGYRIFNTWMGDPAKLLMLEVVLDEYEKHGLIENAARVGQILKDGIQEQAIKHPGLIGRVRGSGSFLAWSVNNTETRDSMVAAMRNKGVQTSGCGAYSIRLRPSMVFGEQHAAEFLRIFGEVMNETKIVGVPREWNTKDPRNVVDVKSGKQGEFHRKTMEVGPIAEEVEA